MDPVDLKDTTKEQLEHEVVRLQLALARARDELRELRAAAEAPRARKISGVVRIGA